MENFNINVISEEDKERVLKKAEKDFKRANMKFHQQFNRSGITEQEKDNLSFNTFYANLVKTLINQQFGVM